MRTKHMDLRVKQRGMGEDVIALVDRFGEFNPRGDRIILTRKIIRKLLQQG